MVDLGSLRNYLINVDKDMELFVIHSLKHQTLPCFIEFCFNHCNCNRVNNDGLRLMQTVGYPYMRSITELLYTINNHVEDCKLRDELLERLIKLHEDNLKYEEANPPVWYGGDKAKRKFNKQYKKQKEVKEKKTKEAKPKGRSRKLDGLVIDLTFIK